MGGADGVQVSTKGGCSGRDVLWGWKPQHRLPALKSWPPALQVSQALISAPLKHRA